MTTRIPAPYIRRTMIIDTKTGEILEEHISPAVRHHYVASRTRGHPYQGTSWPFRSREARELLIAGCLVTLMGILLWILAWQPRSVILLGVS
jgi:hypothetical protein